MGTKSRVVSSSQLKSCLSTSGLIVDFFVNLHSKVYSREVEEYAGATCKGREIDVIVECSIFISCCIFNGRIAKAASALGFLLGKVRTDALRYFPNLISITEIRYRF